MMTTGEYRGFPIGLFNREIPNKSTVLSDIQSTPDNSNLQGKSKKGSSYWESKKIAESKVKNSFQCTANILITFQKELCHEIEPN